MTFLDQLVPADRDALCALGRRRRSARHATILYEGDEPNEIVVVCSGDLKVSTSVDGRDVVLDIVGPGHVVGEVAAIDGRPRSASVVALTAAEVIVIPTPHFLDLMAVRPGVAMSLLRTVSGRLRDASRRQAEHGALDAVGRVCRRLVELMERYGHTSGSDVMVRGPLSQGDVADWAGLSREAVVAALRSMRRLGWVSTAPGLFVVHDVAAVRLRAAAD